MCRSRSRFFVPFASRISGQNDRVVFRVIAARYSNYAKLQRKRRIQKIAFAGIRRVTRLQSRLVTTYRPNTASERYNFFWTESFFYGDASQWRCANFAERDLSSKFP